MKNIMQKILFVFAAAVIFSGCSAKKTQYQNERTSPMPLTQQSSPAATPFQMAAASQSPAVSTSTVVDAVGVGTLAIINTSKGEIVIELYPLETPNTVKNFVDKAKSGYYKGLTFHRVESWVVQGGDPKGNGTGGGTMPTELSERAFAEGSVGVARGGNIKISNDSQFFICTQDCNWLTGQYTNFGTVKKGMDVVKKMEIGDTITSIEIAHNEKKQNK